MPRSLRGYSQTETRRLIKDAAAVYEAALVERERAKSASRREHNGQAIEKAPMTAEAHATR
jgi:hypothetical protein